MRAGRRITVGLIAPTLALMGGHAVQAMRMVEGWRGDSEIQLRLVPSNPAPARALRWLTRVKYVRTLVTQLMYWPALIHTLRHVDVVHIFAASNSSFFVAALPAVLVARAYRRPVIVNYRGDSGDHLAASAAARAALRSVALNVVPSVYFQRILAQYGIPSQIVANIADRTRFRYRVRDPIRPRLLSTRNFEPIYNVACTLRAFARIQATHPDASLLLVGAGSQDRALRTLAATLGLRHVTFLGGVPHHEVHRYYDSADVFVQTPVVDNMPASILEAFASGLPVVATRVGGVPVILEHGVHGLLAAEDNDEEVASHVATLLEEPAKARRLAAAAFATCAAYEWPVVREHWRSVYRSLIAAGQAELGYDISSARGATP